jgi:hypothetical protein
MRVYNKRDKTIPADAVYIGRPTYWGNPFTHISTGTQAQFIVKSRDEAVKAYEEWIRAQPEMCARAKHELKGKSLICWCAPLKCHGDVLMKIANE